MPFIPVISSAVPAVQGVVIPTVLVTGKPFPFGSHDFVDAPPTWKEVSDYELGETVVTEGERASVLETGGDLANDRPANKFSYWDAEEFVRRLNAGLPAGEAPYGIPTEAELEFAARGGEAVDVRALMQEEGIEPTYQNLTALAQDKLNGGSGHGLLESFVVGDWPQTAEKRQVEGIHIYTVTDSEIEKALRNPEIPIRAMWMFATGLAGLTKEAVWYDPEAPAPEAKWGKANRLGLFTMNGNLWVWAADGYEEDAYHKTAARDPRQAPKEQDSDRVLRGGSSWCYDPGGVRSSSRHYGHPDGRGNMIGLRVARAVAQNSQEG